MKMQNILFFSLLLATNFISARKQVAPNLIKNLVTEIKHDTHQKNYAYQYIIADYREELKKHQPTKQL